MTRILSAAVLLAACTLSAPARQAKDEKKADDPKSNNKDKILGKWKITTLSEKDKKGQADFEQLGKLGLYVSMEFAKDGTLVMAVGADDPKLLDLVKQGAPGGKISWAAKYRLLAGDEVELYDVKDEELKKMIKGDKAKSGITIKDDAMTIKDPDGSVTKLTRMKETKDKDKPEKK